MVAGPVPSPPTIPTGWVWVIFGPPSGADWPPALPLASWPYPCGFGLSLISKPRRHSPNRCASFRGFLRRKFFRKIFNHRGERIRGRLAEAANRGVAHCLAQFAEQFPVPTTG